METGNNFGEILLQTNLPIQLKTNAELGTWEFCIDKQIFLDKNNFGLNT